MINRSPETAIRNLFDRAATALSHSRDQLDKTRKALKKAILRLSASVNSDDAEVNALLNDIKSSVDVNINLHKLDAQLDNLFVLTNNSDRKNNTSNDTGFYTLLTNALAETRCSEACVATVNAFTEKRLSDREIAQEILQLINQAVAEEPPDEELLYQSLAEK